MINSLYFAIARAKVTRHAVNTFFSVILTLNGISTFVITPKEMTFLQTGMTASVSLHITSSLSLSLIGLSVVILCPFFIKASLSYKFS